MNGLGLEIRMTTSSHCAITGFSIPMRGTSLSKWNAAA